MDSRKSSANVHFTRSKTDNPPPPPPPPPAHPLVTSGHPPLGSGRNRFWITPGMDLFVEWATDPRNYSIYSNPRKAPGKRAVDVYRELIAKVNQVYGARWRTSLVSSKLSYARIKYEAVRAEIEQAEANNVGENELQKLKMSLCPYYDRLHAFYTGIGAGKEVPGSGSDDSESTQGKRAASSDTDSDECDSGTDGSYIGPRRSGAVRAQQERDSSLRHGSPEGPEGLQRAADRTHMKKRQNVQNITHTLELIGAVGGATNATTGTTVTADEVADTTNRVADITDRAVDITREITDTTNEITDTTNKIAGTASEATSMYDRTSHQHSGEHNSSRPDLREYEEFHIRQIQELERSRMEMFDKRSQELEMTFNQRMRELAEERADFSAKMNRDREEFSSMMDREKKDFAAKMEHEKKEFVTKMDRERMDLASKMDRERIEFSLKKEKEEADLRERRQEFKDERQDFKQQVKEFRQQVQEFRQQVQEFQADRLNLVRENAALKKEFEIRLTRINQSF